MQLLNPIDNAFIGIVLKLWNGDVLGIYLDVCGNAFGWMKM